MTCGGKDELSLLVLLSLLALLLLLAPALLVLLALLVVIILPVLLELSSLSALLPLLVELALLAIPSLLPKLELSYKLIAYRNYRVFIKYCLISKILKYIPDSGLSRFPSVSVCVHNGRSNGSNTITSLNNTLTSHMALRDHVGSQVMGHRTLGKEGGGEGGGEGGKMSVIEMPPLLKRQPTSSVYL